MKHFLLFFVAIVLSTGGIQGCGDTGINSNSSDNVRLTGSGNLETREMDFSGFSKIEVGSVFKATVVKSEDYSVTLHLDDNVFPYLRAIQKEGRLILDLHDVDSTQNLTLKAEIAMPDLEAAVISGVSSAEISGFELDHAVEFDVSGVSHLSGNISAGDVKCTLSGVSKISLSGSGGDLDADVSGTSNFELSNFTSHNADINIDGVSNGIVNVSGTLNANLSGASTLRYLGTPLIGDVSTSVGSSLIKGQ